MGNELRNSGIDVIGGVPWGTHFCQFYTTKQDLVDVLVPYFKAGLEGNEFCMWITSEPLMAAGATEAMRKAVSGFDEYLRRGQMEIIPYNEWYLLGGTFDDDRGLEGWVSKLEQALARGYSGLRMSGNTLWLDRNHWQAFTEYEANVNDVIGRYRMLAICTYCLDECDAGAVIDVIRNHQFSLVKHEEKWDVIEGVIFKRAREALIQSQETIIKQRDQIANILNSMVDGIYIVNEQHDVEFANHVLKTQFGAFEGRKCYQYLNDKEEVCPWCENDAVFAGGKVVSREWHSEKKDKTYDLTEVPLNNVDGSVSKLVVFRDVTNRKQAEQALQENERDLKHAQAVAHIGSWRLDVQRDRLLWSDETYRIFGIPDGTPMTYETFLSSVHTDDRKYVNRKWTAALRGEPYDIEHRIVADDKVKWVREKAELEFDSGGELRGGFGTVQDITERKMSEEQYRTIVRTAMDGFWLVDADGRLLDVNDSYCRLTGYSREELLTMSITDVEAAEAPQETAQHIERVKRKGYDRFETRHHGKDGQTIDVEVSVNFMEDEGGRFFVFVSDITERKRADQMKDEFIGLVSHELRTPLTVISGSLQTAMSQGISPEDVHELLQNAVEGAASLGAILENMLELSRYQAGRLQLRNESVTIPDIAKSVTQKLRRQGLGRRFVMRFPQKLPNVQADPVRVERILFNLMENAAKYSPEGSRITVSGRTQGNFVVTRITDQGPGISQDDQARIFERFQRLGTSLQRTKGVGLGLVVCKRLVEAQRGWIKVVSEVGKGSTFYFALPKHRTT
jgi:PAS domain S-box-containing protein